MNRDPGEVLMSDWNGIRNSPGVFRLERKEHRTSHIFLHFLWCSVEDNGIINDNGHDIVCFLTKTCHIRAICRRYNACNVR